jgi:phosphate transport system substrate-binding protein
MTPEQMQGAAGKILHFPTVLGGVVPIYNIPGVSAELKFTGALLADIFLGKVTKWNDPAIAKVNAGVTLTGHGHRRRPSLGRLGHDLHLRGLPGQGLA